jgi:predicted ArsR family transcriptional regulator
VPQGFSRLVDDDIEQAAGAVAATLETAARGVIYEHAAASLPAQRLATELTALLGQIREQGGTVSDAEAAIALRAIEQGARDAKKTSDGTHASYAALIARLLQVRRAQGQAAKEPAKTASPLILP